MKISRFLYSIDIGFGRNTTIKNLDLDKAYYAIHIRRGDKIALGEAIEMKEFSILDVMISNGFNSENRQLVIISDDTNFAQSVSRVISSRFSVRCIVNPFSSFQAGNVSVAFTLFLLMNVLMLYKLFI